MAKNIRTEPPYAIMVHWPEQFFKEYPGGEEAARKKLEEINDSEKDYWFNTIANIPTCDVGYCYICFKGFVQYRMNIMEFKRNQPMVFMDGGERREFAARNWVLLCGPVVKAPKERFERRGFQGFRYSQELF